MIQKFVIEGNLVGLNELMVKGHWAKVAQIKSEAMRVVQIYAMRDRIRPIKAPIVIHIHCFEKAKRRDRDNVLGGASKVIQDALVGLGTLPNDNPAWIVDNKWELDYDKARPRIEVTLEEVE